LQTITYTAATLTDGQATTSVTAGTNGVSAPVWACNVMTSYPIANSTYYVYATALIFTFTPFIINCGNTIATITYTATSNATTLPTFITLTSATQEFSIYT
jgi:S-methylmethionine-dependent homocysteine/selenocysteine methylase